MPNMSKYKPSQLSDQIFTRLVDVNIPNILNQEVFMAALVYAPAHTNPKWAHKDTLGFDPKNIELNRYALNIPLINCDNSLTTFYNDKKELIMEWPWNNAKRTHTKRIHTKVDAIDSYVLNQPIFFNTQVFHAVENFNDSPRYAISLRFKKNPLHWI